MRTLYVLQNVETNNFLVGTTAGSTNRMVASLKERHSLNLKVFYEVKSESAALGESHLYLQLEPHKRSDQNGLASFCLTPDKMKTAIASARAQMETYANNKENVRLLEGISSEDRTIVAPWNLQQDFQRLLEIRALQDRLKLERANIELKLKLAMGTADTLEDMATWKTVVSRRLNRRLLKEVRPEIYAEFAKESQGRVFRLLKPRVG